MTKPYRVIYAPQAALFTAAGIYGISSIRNNNKEHPLNRGAIRKHGKAQ